MVLLLGAPVTQHANGSCERRVIGDDHAGLAVGAEVLARVETEAGHVAHTADAPALVLCSVGLATVLDHHQTVLLGDLENRVHVGRLAIQVYWDDRLRLVGDRRLQCRHVQRERLRIDVDEDRRGAGVVDGRRGRDERERHGDDFIAPADTGRKQGEVQRARSRIHADALLRLTVVRELVLEGDHFAAQRELAAVQDTLDCGVHLAFD